MTSSSHLLLLSTLLYDNLLSFVFFMYSHPLHLAYLLYFSPYIIQLLSFLFPLLLSTGILIILFSLHSVLEGEDATVCLLEQLGSMLVATIGDLFEWEFEAMWELYDIVGPITEVEDENPAQICVEDSAKRELLQSDVGNGERIDVKAVSLGSQHFKWTMGEVGEDQILSCEPGSHSYGKSMEPVELSSEDSKSSEISEADANQKGCSFVPQTPDRASEFLTNSHLARRAKQRSGSFESLSRNSSMRSESMKIGGGPGEMFWECSENNELSRSWSWKGRSFNSASHISKMYENLNDSPSSSVQRDGSMRKEKEWKRTLACKLYEERMSFKLREETTNVAEEAEEMDLLWEAYEADANKANKFKNKGKNGKKEACIEEEDEEEEDDDSVGRFCCLQALRFSSGKMNFGTTKPNLARVSKVFKGIGFFRRSRSSRSRKE